MNIGYYLLVLTTLLQLVPYIPNMHYIPSSSYGLIFSGHYLLNIDL